MGDALLQMSFHRRRNVTAVVDRVVCHGVCHHLMPLGISVGFKVFSRVLVICR